MESTMLVVVAALIAGVNTWPQDGDLQIAEESLRSEHTPGERFYLPRHAASRIHKRSLAEEEEEEVASSKTFGALSKRCLAPGQMKGKCTHIKNCQLDAFKENPALVFDYLCVIKHTYVGVCCPDSDKLSGGLLGTGILPAILGSILGHTTSTTPSTPHKPGPNVPTPTRKPGPNVPTPTRKPGGITPAESRGCGLSSLQSTRIVGGQPADLKEWPWMVAVVKVPDIQYCGGVLITDRHVLTAAHCVVPVPVKNIRVRLGEYDLSTTSESPSREFAVEQARVHKDYSASSYENDIAVLKMRKPTAFNNYIWPVCLPPPGIDSWSGKKAVVIGWGTLSFGGPASITLMEVEVPVWNRSLCKTKFTQPIIETFLCAGAYEGGKDSCQGDSGGPLLHQLDNGRWVNIGVVSWGIRCGDPGRPGVYTRVDKYLDWISDNALF